MDIPLPGTAPPPGTAIPVYSATAEPLDLSLVIRDGRMNQISNVEVNNNMDVSLAGSSSQVGGNQTLPVPVERKVFYVDRRKLRRTLIDQRYTYAKKGNTSGSVLSLENQEPSVRIVKPGLEKQRKRLSSTVSTESEGVGKRRSGTNPQTTESDTSGKIQ